MAEPEPLFERQLRLQLWASNRKYMLLKKRKIAKINQYLETCSCCGDRAGAVYFYTGGAGAVFPIWVEPEP